MAVACSHAPGFTCQACADCDVCPYCGEKVPRGGLPQHYIDD